jgi:hypothetical protein
MLKCISNDWPNDNLTIGKTYEPHKMDFHVDDYYYLEGDGGIFKYYDKECFIDVQKIRHDKLNELGI